MHLYAAKAVFEVSGAASLHVCFRTIALFWQVLVRSYVSKTTRVRLIG